MAKRCVFCGKNLSFFDDKTLLCGNALQRVCTACWAELQDLDQEERAHRALDTGRAEEPEVIQAYLDRLEQMRQAQARAREALKTDKRCLRCGGVMERYGRKKFHLGEESLFGTVAPDNLLKNVDGPGASFLLQDKDDAGLTLPVVYKGAVPDTFKAGAEVIVEGGLQPDGRFMAKTLMTKCPSKYQKENRKS